MNSLLHFLRLNKFVHSWITLSSSQQEWLKVLALSLMTLDHVNKVFDAQIVPVLGRLAFPLFVFLISYNTTIRNVKPQRYLTPLVITFILSQPLAMWVLDYRWNHFNIMATLFLGVSFQPAVKFLKTKIPHARLLIIVFWFLLSMLVDYGPAGVFLLPVMQIFLARVSWTRGLTLIVFFLAINQFSHLSWVVLLLPCLLLFRSPLSIPRIKNLGYIYYPFHLLVLGLLRPIV